MTLRQEVFMGKIVILGTANAIADEVQENTHLYIQQGERIILVDCASNPVVHLRKAKIDFNQISDIILTHFHPDHVSGAPLLLMDMWLMGRKHPLRMYGLEHTISRMEKLMDLFEWRTWPGFFPVEFITQPEEELAPLIHDAGLHIYSSPVDHLTPTMGIRIEFPGSGGSAAYSSDTQPSQSVSRLARGVDVLIHEATGAVLGHSSARQAGEIAAQAGAASLYLIHYPINTDIKSLRNEAQEVFSGKVQVSRDFMEINLN
jgi:ribonuclease Z